MCCAALIEAVYQPSRRSGASPAVVVKLFDKPANQTTSNGAVTSGESVREKTGQRKTSSLQIIDRDVVFGEGKTKMQWLKTPMLYKVSLVHFWCSAKSAREPGCFAAFSFATNLI